MTDLSKLSDADLAKMYQGSPLGGMTDDQLKGAYQKSQPQSAFDKLVGNNGPRYQTWPERAIRDALYEVPKNLIDAANSAPAGSSEATANMVGPAVDAAATFTPMSRAPALFGVKPGSIAAPSVEALEQAAKQGYEQARASGVTVAPEALAGLQQQIGNKLMDQGYLPATAPKTFGVLKEMTPPTLKAGETLGQVEIPAMEAMRRGFRRAGMDYTESDAARRAIGQIDDLLTPLSPELAKARGNSAAAFRAEDIGALLDKAERQAARSGNGANFDNAIRQKMSSKLDSKNGTMGLSETEIAQLNKIVEGTPIGNVARTLSKLSPQHPLTGWPASVAAGMAGTQAGGVTGGAIGAIATPAIGMIAKIIAEKSTEKQARMLDEMIRKRSPLYEDMLSGAQAEVPASVKLISKALMQNALEQPRHTTDQTSPTRRSILQTE